MRCASYASRSPYAIELVDYCGVAFLRARLLFAEGSVSITHLRLPCVVLRAVSQLGLERLKKRKTQAKKEGVREKRTIPSIKKLGLERLHETEIQ